ncbi:MAG: DEAD/DEAH box helicase [Symploca sp. SIO1A3]|nr:DEAD/DEAH box helicase [Symploca sp. SIO1A3]
MAILHGSWIPHQRGGNLFIWGETWRTKGSVEATTTNSTPRHPWAMTQEQLTSFLDSQSLSPTSPNSTYFVGTGRSSGKKNPSRVTGEVQPPWQTQVIALPTQPPCKKESAYPLMSATMPTETEAEQSLELRQWTVEGFCLEPLAAVKFLQLLPLGSFQTSDSYVGGDLRYWSQITRWSLDLLSRHKFLAGIYRQPNGDVLASWQPLLDSSLDQERLGKFSQLMPSACLAYLGTGNREQGIGNREENCFLHSIGGTKLSWEASQELLLSFLNSTIDSQVRSWLGEASPPATVSPVQEWLKALSKNAEPLQGEPSDVARLEAALQSWTTPVQQNLVTPNSQTLGQNLFRTCLVLQPPAREETNPGEGNWQLVYCLQAVNKPDFLVDAQTIWQQSVGVLEYQGRTIEQPQETLLKGLGLAVRLYPPIEPSLHQKCPSYCELTPVDVYEFIKGSAWRLQNNGLGIVLPPGLAPGAGAKRLGISISAEIPKSKKQERLGLNSLLKFKWELAIGDKTISKQEFDRLMGLQSPIVEVDGEWMALNLPDVKAAQTILASTQNQMSLSVEDALRLSTGDTTTMGKLPVVNFEASGALQQLITNLTGNKSIELIETPGNFRGQLRPYQLRGVSWLAFLERWGLGACLADDMGLGKTPQFIAFLLHLQEQELLDKPTLVVCPTSVLGNWEREVKKFGPSLKTIVHHGDKRSKRSAFAKAVKDKQVVITSYPLIYRDLTTLQGVEWQGVALDEAQNIKNPSAKQSQAIRQLSAEFRVALTGTPVENRLAELWSILDFLNPGYLGERQFFQRRFALPIEKFGDTDSLRTLRSLVQPFILRRLKTDKSIIQDLPDKQEMTVFCGLSAEQATIYQKLVDESLEDIESAEGIQRHGKILTLLMQLKQICNHPAHYLKQKSLGLAGRSGKLMRLQEMLEEVIAEDDRALIFTQFAEWGKLIKPYLEKQFSGEVLFLYGATRKKQREEMVDRFQHDPEGPRIFILSLKAGGTGLNLTRANHVFHVDRWWNPAVENQATDRAFRIGQTRNVQVHKFVCTGTLEERINDIIESKKQLAEQTVDAGEQWLTEMDTNQLRSLLLLDRSAVIDE